MSLKRSLTFFLLGLNLVFVLFLLLGFVAPYISPAKIWWMAFFGLSFPLLFFLNTGWIIFWLFTKKKLALISFAALLISLINISAIINLFSGCLGETSKGKYTIMTYNVKTFDLYNWNHNVETKNAMLGLIEDIDPDVLCLQEFYTDDSEDFNIIERLAQRYPNQHFQRTLSADGLHHWGIATFSKFPIINKDVLPFENAKHNLSIASDIIFDNDTLRIFNAHLQSIHFGREEYTSMENITTGMQGKIPVLKIFSKLKSAFIKRAHQADVLAEHLQTSPKKVILCADLNDSPNSYAYRTVSNGFKDSFKEAGCGLDQTYYGPFPSFRIDIILADNAINVQTHEVIENAISDHYPVVSSFSLN